MPLVRLSDLNEMTASAFVGALSSVYESTAWVPQSVVSQRPFRDLSHLHARLAAAAAEADTARQLELIRAFPDLAQHTQATSGVSEESQRELAASGLSSLNSSEHAQLGRLLNQYRERHGFPFVVAVLTLDRDAIIRSLAERCFNQRDAEVQRALAEISAIALLRLKRIVVDSNSAARTVESGLPTPDLGSTRSSTGTRVVDVQYGKSRVRVARVLRDGPVHELIEVTVQVLLRGPALTPSFTRGDNAPVVPTDTVKNTISVLARQSLTGSIEEFGERIGSHFLHQYAHVTSVDITLSERVWERLHVSSETKPGTFNGPPQPHAHTFRQRGPETPTAHVVATRAGVWIESGVQEYTVLKTTASGFTHFPRCPLTTLAETEDRILATKLSAQWSFNSTPTGGFRAANSTILRALLDRFATRYSVSVQATMYEMALDAFAACAHISAIRLTLPNVHFLPLNMRAFGLDNPNIVFTPTDEPHGTIQLKLAHDTVTHTPHSQLASESALAELVFPTSEPCAPLPPKPKL